MPHIIFIEENGIEKKALAEIGETILEVARANDVNIEGACGGNMACATCHVYVNDEWYNKLDEKTEGEDDMIDQAYDPKKNSRLSCQITVSEKIEGLVVRLPEKQV